MKKETDTYEPFSKEWEAEMMKWSKKHLIEFLRKTLINAKQNAEAYAQLLLSQLEKKLP